LLPGNMLGRSITSYNNAQQKRKGQMGTRA